MNARKVDMTRIRRDRNSYLSLLSNGEMRVLETICNESLSGNGPVNVTKTLEILRCPYCAVYELNDFLDANGVPRIRRSRPRREIVLAPAPEPSVAKHPAFIPGNTVAIASAMMSEP